MTDKVAFMNENDNDSHLDLQVKIKELIFLWNLLYLLPFMAK